MIRHSKTPFYLATLLLIAAGLAVAGVAGATQLSIENRFIDYFKKSTEIYQGMRLIDEQLGGTTPLDVLIDAPAAPPEGEEDFEEPDFLAGFDDLELEGDSGIATTSYWLNSARLPEIRRIHEYLESLDGTGKVMSVITATPSGATPVRKPNTSGNTT